MEKDYSEYNAENVLKEVEKMIDGYSSYPIINVYRKLSIFDWWPEYLKQSHLKQMRNFLKLAIELGYTGYVCFKVGAEGCSNGMWAAKEPTTNGYSPLCATIYRSFTPSYTYYSITKDDREWLPKGDEYDSLRTPAQFKKYIRENNL